MEEYEHGRTRKSLADEYGLTLNTVSQWITQSKNVKARLMKSEAERIIREDNAKLRKENEELKKENDFLKKAAAFFAKEVK